MESMSMTMRSYFCVAHVATASSAVLTCLCMIYRGSGKPT